MDFVRYSYLVSILQCLLLIATAQKQTPDNGGTFLETCLENAWKSIEAKIGMLTDLNEKEKEELTATLQKQTQKISENEQRALAVKYIKRRVQFTKITDAISLNQRSFSQMESAIIEFQNKTGLSSSLLTVLITQNVEKTN